jgi:hypothetical protein
VADALDQLLHDNSEPISLRCTIAVALGRMNFQAPAKLDTLAAAKELGYLALVACDAELNRVKELKQMETDRAARMSGQIQTGSGSGGGAEGFGDPMPMGPGTGLQGAVGAPPGGVGMPMPGVGGGGFGGADVLLAADPKGYRFDVVRRRIRQQLYCVQFGLTGGEDFIPGKAPVTPPAGSPEAIKMPPRGMNAFAKPGDEKKYVSDVYDKVRKLVDVCENKATDMATLEKELRKNMKSLEAITKKLTPAPTPAGGVSPDAPGTPVAARAAAADAPAPMPPAAPKPSPPDLTAPAGPPPAGGAAPAPPPVGAAPAPTPPPAAGKPPAPPVPAAAP